MSARPFALLALALPAVPLACFHTDDNTPLVDGGPLTFDSGGFDSPIAPDSGANDAHPTDASLSDAVSSDAAIDVSFDAPNTPCGAYCAAIMTYCTGANAQYPSFESCLGACAPLPLGTASDTSGDTLGCRAHYAAQAQSSPATACANAGPTGGGDIKGGSTAGACGDACEAFCTIAQTVCDGTNKQFADVPTCMGACRSFTPTQNPPFSTADMTTNDYGCRMNQLTTASANATSVQTYCPHIVPNSSTCLLGINVTIDGTDTAFDANLSVTNSGGVVTVKGDDNTTTTHWTMQLVMSGSGQQSCSPSNPVITYTHYTSGVADSVYSTKTGAGMCSLDIVQAPAAAGDRAEGSFYGTLVRDVDAGGGSHVLTNGGYIGIQ
jgi:hypothetical protein